MSKKFGYAFHVPGKARKKGTVKYVFTDNEFQRNLSAAGMVRAGYKVRKLNKKVV